MDFNGPIGLTTIPLPEIKNFKKYITFKISNRYNKELDKLFSENNFVEMWKIVDDALLNNQLYKKIAHKEKSVIVRNKNSWAVQVWKPVIN